MSNNAYFVLAGDYGQFDYLCRFMLGVPARYAERNGFRYISDVNSMCGYQDIYVIRYGTYHNRSDYYDIMIRLEYMHSTIEDYDDRPF